MRSSSREEIVEKFDALEAALDAVLELSCDALTTPSGSHWTAVSGCGVGCRPSSIR
ncbi:hypothetical protein I553_2932 [Mycobacterium xenopi 4042]|uniref:Uncharacterized protein n=1 Tax=Mycobacterium xenopi 4042 TaxID=1299334 RepID=X8ECJ5_MYCXE|nr:hypothetical protein I553_2932 [Mycobacterium xenopi 4042]